MCTHHVFLFFVNISLARPHLFWLTIIVPSLLTYNRTFTKNQVSIEHATESILSTLLSSSTSTGEEYTYTKIRELTTFTKHQVFTLLGTWTRSECLEIGHQLQEMDLDVRVIPYSEGLLEMNMNTAAGVVAPSSPSSPPMRTSSSQLSSLPSPSLLEESSRGDGNDDTVVVVGRSSSRRSSAASSSSDYLLSLWRKSTPDYKAHLLEMCVYLAHNIENWPTLYRNKIDRGGGRERIKPCMYISSSSHSSSLSLSLWDQVESIMCVCCRKYISFR